MELDESARYTLVTKGALSFNDSPESAKNEYERIRKERGGARKGQKFIKNRGANVSKFVFPAGCVLISEMKYHHCNILMPLDVNIEKYRDINYEGIVDYDNYETK